MKGFSSLRDLAKRHQGTKERTSRNKFSSWLVRKKMDNRASSKIVQDSKVFIF